MYRKQLYHLTHCPTLLAALAGGGTKAWSSQSISSLTRWHLCCSAASCDSPDPALVQWGDEQRAMEASGHGPLLPGGVGNLSGLTSSLGLSCIFFTDSVLVASLTVFCLPWGKKKNEKFIIK